MVMFVCRKCCCEFDDGNVGGDDDYDDDYDSDDAEDDNDDDCDDDWYGYSFD